MDRRGFLGLAASGLVVGCAPHAPRRDDDPSPAPSPDDPSLADTGPALDDRVPRSLMKGDASELDVQLEVLSGALPNDWSGHGLLVHTVPFKDGSPVFMGDGKVLRLDFHPDRVDLTSRIVRTPCHYADLATLGHADGFGNQDFARRSNSLGFRNFPNTALVALGDRLLVTSDAGRPWEIDPITLEAITPVGANEEWTGILPDWMQAFVDWPFPLHMGTAHPAVDPETGELFALNYGIPLFGGASFTDLLRWDGEGPLTSWRVADRATGKNVTLAQSAHQIAVTRNHVILMDTAFLVEISLTGDAEPVAQHPDTILYVVRRSDLHAGNARVSAHRVVLPREAVHFHADFDDADGIVLHVAHNCAADPSEWLRAGDLTADGAPVDPALVGLPCAPTDLGAWGRYVLDPVTGALVDARVRHDERLWGGPALVALRGPDLADRIDTIYWCNAGIHPELRLRRIEQMYAGYPYREVALEDLPTRPANVVRIDGRTGEVVDDYPFPAGRMCLSPVFVPRQGSEADDDGYLVMAVISDAGDELWVFDASNLAQGPLARLGHPDLVMPFTLHTLWVPRVASRTATYQVDIRADLERAVSKLSPELQALFEDEVYPHFA